MNSESIGHLLDQIELGRDTYRDLYQEARRISVEGMLRRGIRDDESLHGEAAERFFNMELIAGVMSNLPSYNDKYTDSWGHETRRFAVDTSAEVDLLRANVITMWSLQDASAGYPCPGGPHYVLGYRVEPNESKDPVGTVLLWNNAVAPAPTLKARADRLAQFSVKHFSFLGLEHHMDSRLVEPEAADFDMQRSKYLGRFSTEIKAGRATARFLMRDFDGDPNNRDDLIAYYQKYGCKFGYNNGGGRYQHPVYPDGLTDEQMGQFDIMHRITKLASAFDVVEAVQRTIITIDAARTAGQQLTPAPAAEPSIKDPHPDDYSFS